uniref:Uncharacterized protein n=1 Tax=Tetranychus urticae TaxID=32264 RepID=T1KJM1_TETUR
MEKRFICVWSLKKKIYLTKIALLCLYHQH